MTIKEKQQTRNIVEHELALKVYIDSLLFEESELKSTQEEEKAPMLQVVADAPEQLVQPTKERVTEAEVKIAVEVVPEKAGIDPVPTWADGSFESVLFKVAGVLTLAVPLIKLNGILEWSDDVTPMPGHSDWFLGLLPKRGKQIKVIDVAKFVIPENHSARAGLGMERKFTHIILINDGEFGLACDGLGDVLKLDNNQVRWRDDRSSRPWLAGTVIDKMCAILDIDYFTEMLKNGAD